MSTPNPYPKVCPHCYGRVYLCTNDVIYGRQYGYPWIYYCPTCGAYVGCHKGTYRALGGLANAEERRQRKELHDLFDTLWKGKKHSHYKRSVAYRELSVRLYGNNGEGRNSTKPISLSVICSLSYPRILTSGNSGARQRSKTTG